MPLVSVVVLLVVVKLGPSYPAELAREFDMVFVVLVIVWLESQWLGQ